MRVRSPNPALGAAYWAGERRLTRRDVAAWPAIVFQDVTARKRAEIALRTSVEFNRRVLQGSADCLKVLSLDAHIEFGR